MIDMKITTGTIAANNICDLTAAQIDSICMRNSPDFALFDEEMKDAARFQCKCWFEAIRKEFNG